MIEEDWSDIDDHESYSNNVNANSGDPTAVSSTPTTVSSPGNDPEDNSSLEDNGGEKRLYSALVERHVETPAFPRDPSLHRSSELLQEQISQDNDHHVDRGKSGELPCPGLNASEEDNKGQMGQQHQQVDEEREEQHENISDYGEIENGFDVVPCSKSSSDQEGDLGIDQDCKKVESLRPAEQFQRPLSHCNSPLRDGHNNDVVSSDSSINSNNSHTS